MDIRRDTVLISEGKREKELFDLFRLISDREFESNLHLLIYYNQMLRKNKK